MDKPDGSVQLTGSQTEGGVVSFNPCMMWEQIGLGVRFGVLVAGVAFLYFAVQGFLNRCGPRWFAAAGLLAFIGVVLSEWWRVAAGCYTFVDLTAEIVWLGATGTMLVHHALKTEKSSIPISGKPPFPRLIFRLFQVAVFLLLVLSVTDGTIGVVARGRNATEFAVMIVVAVSRLMNWNAAVILALGALGGVAWVLERAYRTFRL